MGDNSTDTHVPPTPGECKTETPTQETRKLVGASSVSRAFPTWTRFALPGRLDPQVTALKHLAVTAQSPNSHPQPAVRTVLSPQCSGQHPSPHRLGRPGHCLCDVTHRFTIPLSCRGGSLGTNPFKRSSRGPRQVENCSFGRAQALPPPLGSLPGLLPPSDLFHNVTWPSQTYLPLQLSW